MENEMDNAADPAEAIFAGADDIRENEARVNVTWNGQNGDMLQPVTYNATEGDIKQWVTEAVQNGSIPGIVADADADFTDFVVDRFAQNEVRPFSLISVRPKTPFGLP